MISELYELIRTVGILYIYIVIIASFLSFIRPDPHHPIVQALGRMTEPVFAWIRKKMPFVILGGMDLTPLVIIFGLQFIDIIIRNVLLG
jgi:YggT family protein